MKWEYRIFGHDFWVVDQEEFSQWLNGMGDEGWELAACL